LDVAAAGRDFWNTVFHSFWRSSRDFWEFAIVVSSIIILDIVYRQRTEYASFYDVCFDKATRVSIKSRGLIEEEM